MKKIFFFDIDGTLLDTPKGLAMISQKNQEAILALKKQGHATFIATGRTKSFIVKPIREFPFDGFVTCNGAYVEYLGKCVYKKAIETEAIKALVTFCEQYDFDYYLESYDTIYVNNVQKDSVVEFALRWEMDQDIMVDDFDIEKIEIYIAMIKVNEEKDIDKVYEALSDYYDISCHPNQLSLDLNIRGENKGTGITHLLHTLQWSKEASYAFGDGNNDLEMIEAVGCGIAMGNAVAPLKQRAKMVTTDVHHDGVAEALKELGLIKK